MNNKFCNVVIVWITILWLPYIAMSECWDVTEISELAFHELDGAIVFSNKN